MQFSCISTLIETDTVILEESEPESPMEDTCKWIVRYVDDVNVKIDATEII